ncbi:5-formyltetrahydrofolate cyclo-ligase [Corynebacterium mendelii]|uniref:5-formyltetrahydrofolate cyclo-ligase n=1 Tax=Corynebacterium mendelii TaxID=2765362 RepID=A0A939E3E8_9CORY|nr:5-formyltetrahydrofolate cyclo-ligase [Corynebacterium mendelii]
MDIQQDKNRLRRMVLAARAEREKTGCTHIHRAVARQLGLVLARLQPTGIAAYAPLPGEPGAGFLLDTVLDYTRSRGGRLWLPVCGPKHSLTWGTVTGVEQLARGAFGIPEPAGHTVSTAVMSADIQVMVIPALACGRDGSRLGRGAGYYDRALAGRNRSRITVVAVTGPGELVDAVAAGPLDQPVDMVVTDCGITVTAPVHPAP